MTVSETLIRFREIIEITAICERYCNFLSIIKIKLLFIKLIFLRFFRCTDITQK